MNIDTLLQTILLYSLAIFAFMFVWWRGIKDEIGVNEAITTSVYLALALLIGLGAGAIASQRVGSISNFFTPSGLGYWFAVLFSFLCLYFTMRHSGVGFFDYFEKFVNAMLWMGLFVTGMHLVVVALSLFLFIWFRSTYKKISWYKSGKVGFAGLMAVAFYFLIRAVVELLMVNLLSFGSIGRIDGVFSIGVVFLAIYSLYNLANNTN